MDPLNIIKSLFYAPLPTEQEEDSSIRVTIKPVTQEEIVKPATMRQIYESIKMSKPLISIKKQLKGNDTF